MQMKAGLISKLPEAGRQGGRQKLERAQAVKEAERMIKAGGQMPSSGPAIRPCFPVLVGLLHQGTESSCKSSSYFMLLVDATQVPIEQKS